MATKMTYAVFVEDVIDIPKPILEKAAMRFAEIMNQWGVSPFDAVHLVDMATYDDIVDLSQGITDYVTIECFQGMELVFQIHDLLLACFPTNQLQRLYIHKSTKDFNGKPPLDVMCEEELLGLRKVYMALYKKRYFDRPIPRQSQESIEANS